MRSVLKYIVAMSVLLLSQHVGSQTPPADASAPPIDVSPSEAEAHEGLRELQRVMETALNSGDIDAILANVDDRVIFTTMNGDVARGKDGIRQYFERMMKGPDKVVDSVKTDFEPDDLSILHGPDTAIAFGHTNDRYELTNGSSFDIQARWSGTMLRRDGKWIVGSFHYSTNVFDNPILNAQRRLFTWGGIALVAIAAAVAFWLGRRQRG
jgi:uncharacterized protein (TIGR02246 family)